MMQSECGSDNAENVMYISKKGFELGTCDDIDWISNYDDIQGDTKDIISKNINCGAKILKTFNYNFNSNEYELMLENNKIIYYGWEAVLASYAEHNNGYDEDSKEIANYVKDTVELYNALVEKYNNQGSANEVD